jgi:hypothetical protein
MVWKCPPLHLPNWNNLWKWKEEMNGRELAQRLEDRYGNPMAPKMYDDIKLAIEMLRKQEDRLEELEAPKE